MLKVAVLLALVASAQAICRDGDLFDSTTGVSCDAGRRSQPQPVIRTARSADGKSDLMFVVEDGARVGMQVEGSDPMYFNDFESDIKQVGEGNFNAMSIGVEIGKSFVNNFTKDLLVSASETSALKVQLALTEKMTELKADVNFVMTQVKDVCKSNEWQRTAGSGTNAGNYKPPVCEATRVCTTNEYESEAPTSVKDRTCVTHKQCTKTEYKAMAGSAVTDTICNALTVCKDGEEEVKEPTASSDRVCRPAVRVMCSSFAGMGAGQRSVLSLDPKNTKGEKITAICKNDGTYLGGDGSTSLKAGKSCATIRHFFEATTDGAYWTFMNDTGTPMEVYCDMNSCGNDAAIAGKRWGDRVKDFDNCGGWTMAFKWPGQERCSGNGQGGAQDCWKMNRNNIENYKYGRSYGSFKTVSPENAMSPAYSRQSFSDVMLRSISPGWKGTTASSSRKWQSVGWRHPWTATSLMEIANGCRPLHDGELLLPEGQTVNNNIRHNIGNGINWNSRSQSQHHLPENPRTRFGFFGHDYGSCSNNYDVVGCQFEWSGHSRHFIGMHIGNNDPDRPGGSWDSRITSFGVGAGYCAANGGHNNNDRNTATGHWQGHGADNMQIYSSAIFIRDKNDMMG